MDLLASLRVRINSENDPILKLGVNFGSKTFFVLHKFNVAVGTTIVPLGPIIDLITLKCKSSNPLDKNLLSLIFPKSAVIYKICEFFRPHFKDFCLRFIW